tara:strand:+ start:75 stop:686 length:612 start_codon:yes stop_codon:yes gene_type:complete
MKKVFLFLIMFLIVGAYGNNGAIESSIVHNISMEPIVQLKHRGPHHEGPILLYNVVPIITEYQKQVTCMAKNIFYEAASESTAGRLAVAQVTLNRVKSRHYPNSVCEVVYQGPKYASGFPKRDQCQFSWYCDGKGDDPKDGRLWFESQELAKHVFKYEDSILDITDGATHYHANYIDDPRWADRSKVTASIDQHIFYSFSHRM